MLAALCLFWNNCFSQCTMGNCESGYGEQTISGTQSYRGNFSDGKRNGKGIYTWSSGQKYTGEFKDGDFHGYGIMYIPDGSVYEGEYKYDKKHGLGTAYNSLGEIVFAGEYINGVRITSSSSLPSDMLADKYLLEAKKLMEAGSNRTAIVSFNKILALHVSPPSDFYYFLGKCHYNAYNYRRAIDNINIYLTKTGKNGEYYIKSLEILSNAESRMNREEMDLTEKKLEVINCSVCHGSGIYSVAVYCSSCRGSGQVREACSLCGGSGQGDSACSYPGCNGGIVYFANSNGEYSSYDCTRCVSGIVNCSKCDGYGGYNVHCNNCSGSGQVSENRKCYKH